MKPHFSLFDKVLMYNVREAERREAEQNYFVDEATLQFVQ
jgi:hypothetical protein